jgi:hypothetical protein
MAQVLAFHVIVEELLTRSAPLSMQATRQSLAAVPVVL